MHSPFHLTNGASLAGALEAMGESVGFITLMLSRREIEAGKIGDAVDALVFGPEGRA